jgi:hypothetical protein
MQYLSEEVYDNTALPDFRNTRHIKNPAIMSQSFVLGLTKV